MAALSRWVAGSRELPSSHLGVRHNRDRLSDLESGTLSELAYEDEPAEPHALPLPSARMVVRVERSSCDTPLGVELDMWARDAMSGAEVVVAAVTAGSPADNKLRPGDAIHKLNGTPCCTIEDVRRALGRHVGEVAFEICRPRHTEIFSSDAQVLTADGTWTQVVLSLTPSRVLEMRQDGAAPVQLNLRGFDSVTIRAERTLQLGSPDGDVSFKSGNAADLERWHTLLTQMLMFRPGTQLSLTGWLKREESGASGGGCSTQSWQYFELYSSGTVLVYSSPHRNKLGQALAAVALSQCTVEAEPREAGVWLIRDVDRDRAVWRCSFCQAASADETVEQILSALR